MLHKGCRAAHLGEEVRVSRGSLTFTSPRQRLQIDASIFGLHRGEQRLPTLTTAPSVPMRKESSLSGGLLVRSLTSQS